MVTFTDSDDRRSAHLRNRAIQNANAVRERRATLENPDWLMSRPADWYTELDAQGEPSNWRAAKNVLQHRPAVTTDMNEQRNMFQMLANQAKGGDRGARLIDRRGLPEQAYRTGRKIYQDPSKSQGFFGDMRTMGGDLIPGLSRSPNPAAIHVNEYNPFPKAGFGAEWYKDQFPIASGLGSFMEAAENFIPGATWAKQFLPKSKRLPLERDLSWVPEGVGEYDEIPEIPFMEDLTETIEEETIDDRIPRGPFPPGIAYPGYNADITITDLPEDITETITEDGFVLQESKFPQGNLGTEGNYDYNPIWDLNIMNIQDYELKKKATDAAIQFNNLWKSKEGQEYKSDMYELEKLYEEYMEAVKEGAQPSLEDINFQLDDILEDKADVLNDLEEIKRERKDIDEEAADLGLWYNI